MLFSFVLIAHGLSRHLTFPIHYPFPSSCCCLLPGQLDGSAVEALGDPTVQQVPLTGQLALAPVGQTQLMPIGRLPPPGGSGRGGSRKPHRQESPRASDRFRETPVSFPTWVGGGDSGHSREEQSEPTFQCPGTVPQGWWRSVAASSGTLILYLLLFLPLLLLLLFLAAILIPVPCQEKRLPASSRLLGGEP